jgi:hypothetical protein
MVLNIVIAEIRQLSSLSTFSNFVFLLAIYLISIFCRRYGNTRKHATPFSSLVSILGYVSVKDGTEEDSTGKERARVGCASVASQ